MQNPELVGRCFATLHEAGSGDDLRGFAAVRVLLCAYAWISMQRLQRFGLRVHGCGRVRDAPSDSDCSGGVESGDSDFQCPLSIISV